MVRIIIRVKPEVLIFIFLERTPQDLGGPFYEELKLTPEAPS